MRYLTVNLVTLVLIFTGIMPFSHAAERTTLIESFVGPVTGDTIRYNVVLPAGYDGVRRHPVVYHLHGLGGGPNNHNELISALFESAADSGMIGPVICVFPDGGRGSMWADSKDGATMAETHTIRELIPHVDSTYRTFPFRRARVIQGFSMGGFGAVLYAAKFPDLFCVSVSYDGALHTYETLLANRPQIISAVYSNDETYFDEYSPWHHLALNRNALADSMPFRVVVCDLVQYNRPLRDTLAAYGIEYEYIETGCGHNLDCAIDATGMDDVRFIAARLDTTRQSTGMRPLVGSAEIRPARTMEPVSVMDISGRKVCKRTAARGVYLVFKQGTWHKVLRY